MAPSPSTVAVDIDTGRVHAWSTTLGRICYDADRPPFDLLAKHELILVECASAIIYDKDKKGRPLTKGERINRQRWAIANMAVVGEIFAHLEVAGLGDRMLVAPSSAWTLSHTEKLRDFIAGSAGSDNHDIRQCRNMIFYHHHNPGQWKPYLTYLRSLVHRKDSP